MTDVMQNDLSWAQQADLRDPLRVFRDEFCFPQLNGKPALYFVGNSLGLMPKQTRRYVDEFLRDWETLGVEAHFEGNAPWYPYHEMVTAPLAEVVGAQPFEVIAMNSLTTNLHLALTSFYRPSGERRKVLLERGAFPSDLYAVHSQVLLHGGNPETDTLYWEPPAGEACLKIADLENLLARHDREVCLVLLGDVNYLTGQAFDLVEISRLAHKYGAYFGVDLAHGAGNLPLQLHDCGVDFAVWCSYKYLNSGAGGIGGAFFHERHGKETSLARLAGWWGHNKQNRFLMSPQFDAMKGAEGWQLSNPPIALLACLRSSLDLFSRAGMTALRQKSEQLTGYLSCLLDSIDGVTQITPKSVEGRGAQISFSVRGSGKQVQSQMKQKGVICDFREPNVIRLAPTPLYNSFEDVYRFVEILRGVL